MLLPNWRKQNGGFAFLSVCFSSRKCCGWIQFVCFSYWLCVIPHFSTVLQMQNSGQTNYIFYLAFVSFVWNCIKFSGTDLVFPFTLLSLSRYIRNSLYASNNNNICGTMIRTFLLTSLVVLFIPTTIITIKRVSC